MEKMFLASRDTPVSESRSTALEIGEDACGFGVPIRSSAATMRLKTGIAGGGVRKQGCGYDRWPNLLCDEVVRKRAVRPRFDVGEQECSLRRSI